ncbi:MAG: dihydrolipoyl dehydrogenase [Actinomycetota bacterium]|nr:dihydrolipoyl dehydrogenase [Actinomycetota bacterium]
MKVQIPDLGDFADVPVVELLVAVGDRVAAEDPLIVLESDKATMEIPAPAAGVVEALLVGVGDAVSKGTAIAEISTDGAAPGPEAPASAPPAEAPEPVAGRVDVVVLGAGPGGYTAAFRAADLGLQVVLVERYERLGGVCLNVGCIPSKALLHVAKLLTDAQDAGAQGIAFGEPSIDLDGVRAFKDGAVDRLTGGLDGLAKGRNVRVVHGEARFTGPHELQVADEAIAFEHAIVAAGSSAARLPGFPEDPRIVTSTGALELADVPARLLVVGGGIIGLEMATVYDALGSEVTVVELADQLIPGCDADLVKPLHRRVSKRYAGVRLATTVKGAEATAAGIGVTFSSGEQETFDRVLLAVGRRPNGSGLGLEEAGVTVDERGFVPVDEQLRTNVAHVFAIGDVVGEPMLAHKATHEAKVAAEVIAGHDVAFDARAIPSVAYTDPEVAWVGLTETQAEADDVAYETARFPWAASGRALGIARSEGVTKLLVDPGSSRVLGAGVVGVNAGELVAEIALAIEMGADAEDLALTVHPHPTLSETVGLAAEVAAGIATDLPPVRGSR